MNRRFWITSVNLTTGKFELSTNHLATAYTMASLGFYVFDNKEGRQVVSNDPRVTYHEQLVRGCL